MIIITIVTIFVVLLAMQQREFAQTERSLARWHITERIAYMRSFKTLLRQKDEEIQRLTDALAWNNGRSITPSPSTTPPRLRPAEPSAFKMRDFGPKGKV